jgi:multidrug efflux pump subunit AcrB
VASLTRGMNEQFLYMRKENHLNTCFNVRKNKLRELTKVNKQIYQRLNSQKSLYSSTDMNKSYQSTKQIKERLSQSKLSQRRSLSR